MTTPDEELRYDLVEANRRVELFRGALEMLDDDLAETIDRATHLHGLADPCEPDCRVCELIEHVEAIRSRVKKALPSGWSS